MLSCFEPPDATEDVFAHCRGVGVDDSLKVPTNPNYSMNPSGTEWALTRLCQDSFSGQTPGLAGQHLPHPFRSKHAGIHEKGYAAHNTVCRVHSDAVFTKQHHSVALCALVLLAK